MLKGKISKRLLSLLLTLAMLLGMLPGAVFAADENVIRHQDVTITEKDLVAALKEKFSIDDPWYDTGNTLWGKVVYNSGFTLSGADAEGKEKSVNISTISSDDVDWLQDGGEYKVTYYTRSGIKYTLQPEFTFTYEVYHVITVSVTSGGNVFADGAIKVNGVERKNGETKEVDYGTEVTFEAVPVEGYTAGTPSGVTSPVTTSGTVSVVYTPNVSYAINVSENTPDAGTVKIGEADADGETPVSVGQGNEITLTVDPDGAYYVKEVKVGGTAVEGTYENQTFTYTFTPAADTTVEVTYEEYKLTGETNVKLYINGYLTELAEGLKGKVLDAVFGANNYDAAGYTVTMLHNNLTGGTTTTDVEKNVLGAYVVTAFMDMGETETFYVIKKADNIYPEVSLEVKGFLAESRATLAITTSPVTIEEKTEPADVLDQVKAAISIKATDPQTGAETAVAVSDSYLSWNPTYAWPADGETATFTVTVRVNSLANETYANAPSETLTLTCTDTTILYTIKYMDGLGNEIASYQVAENTAPTVPNDPTREFYTFAGWDSEPVTATQNATYTATWTADVDNNGNKIADQEETYTVVYAAGYEGAEALGTFENQAWGEKTPTIENPTRTGWNFKGWDVSPAETIAAPTSGNTITYTAQWTQLHAVIFMDRDQQYNADEVENNQTVAKPDAPTWDEDHDFLGWYNGESEYDFDTPVTESLTLTAKWRNDFNRNDIEDDTEKHFTVTYNVDGTETKFENVLVDMPTPAFDADPEVEGVQNPAKTGYIFNGWDPEVADTVTADVTYTAQWLADSNGNGVADENETITITVNKANDDDAILVVGASRIGDTDNYLFDSTKENSTVSITANPVVTLDGLTFKSTTYVYSVEGVEGEGSYSEVNYAYTYKFAPANGQAVTVTFAEAKFDYNETRQMDYYVGMPDVTNEQVYSTVVKTPVYDAEKCTITYKAREAMSQTVQLSSLGVSDSLQNVLKLMGIESFDFSMPALWLDVNVETGSKVENSVSLDQAVSQYLTSEKINGLWDVYKAAAEANGGLIIGASAGRKAVQAEIDEIYENIYNAAMYYGAHDFGYNATEAETVTEAIKVTYKNTALYMEGETDITLRDYREPSIVVGNNVSVMYKDYSDEDLVKTIGAYVADKDGNPIENAVLTSLELTDPYTFEGKAVSGTAYELTFRFDGNETYKPSQATFTVTVTKATIPTFDIADVTVEYGSSYSMEPTVVLGNKYGEAKEVSDSQIKFLIGLDVADLDADADGVKGLKSRVQLILPADLQETLNAILEAVGGSVSDGVEMSLSDLTDALASIDSESLDALKQALTAIQSITETGNITIVIGGDLPTDIGAYLYGAVTTNPNYETAMDVAYIVITPAATEVYLDWNYSDTNGVFTHELLQYVNLGASAYEDAVCTTVDEAATALVNNLFFGIDIDGNLVTELFNAGVDPETLEDALRNGAYSQMAFISDFGNEMVYAVPAVRAFLIAPNTVNVVFTEDAGEDHLMQRTYNGEAQVLDVAVTYDGTAITPDEKWLTVTYTGLQSNGETYGPTTEAPSHTGVYKVSATYVQEDENGEIVAVGVNAVMLAIKPADKLAVQVVDTTVGYDSKAHTPEIQFSIDSVAVDASEVDVTYCVLNKAGHTFYLVTEGNSKSLINLIEEVTGNKIDGSNLTSFQNMVAETLAALEDAASDSELAAQMEELFGTDAIEALTLLQSILAQVKEATTGYTYTVSVNAEMPADAGTYQVYVLAAAENYVPKTAQGTLEIKPIDIKVTVDSLTKYCGKDDPDYTYDVAYFDYKGNAIEGPETDVYMTFTREEGETVGEYKITAEAEVKSTNYQVISVTEDAVLKILPVLVTGVTLDKTTLSLVEGTSETLTATVAPEDATDKSVTWTSSDPAVATVDENGKVTAVAPGTATITVTTNDGEMTAACEVTVTIPVTGVTLNKTALSLVEGTSETLTATVAPEDATDKNVTWTSSDPAVATVDENGKVTAVAAGTATITVTTTDGEMTATCEVTVTIPVTGVTLNKTTLSLVEGTSETLTATVAPEDATDKSVTWKSSDPAVATVDENGKVTAVAAGTATITVTTNDGEMTATCEVTVTKATVSVTGVTLDKTTLSLEEGTSETLTATVAPEDATDKSVTWTSSDPTVATVDENGKVTAVAAGTATITVTTNDGEKTATCEVTVTKATVSVTGVTLGETTLSLVEGTSETLTATVAPEDATDKRVTWTSSDPTVATVDENGKVTTVAPGTATITVTTNDGEMTATCEVTVTKATVSVTGVTLDKTTLSLEEGTSETLTATVAPEDATDKSVTWKSSDPAVATVDENGKVTAVAPGTATITVTTNDGEMTATCEVTVTKYVSPFVDVPENAFYSSAVQWAEQNSIAVGITETTYEPFKVCTRGELATFLWRAAGSPEPTISENPFVDVKANRFYYKAILWGVENGIIYGTTKTTFAPEKPCTRGQVAALLWRTAGKPEPKSPVCPFTDVKESASYYKAVIWGKENGIINGITKTTFRPNEYCTRGQMATFLYRFYGK